jgi:sirohydrochlorin ferrochelatase
VTVVGPAPARWSAASTPDDGGVSQPLVLAAHGSRDPGFAQVVADIAAQLRAARPDLAVSVGYLDHGPPLLADLDTAGAVVVPLFLAAGFHVRVDVPEQAGDATLTEAVGPDPLVAIAVRDRLAEAGDGRALPVVLAAAGSSDARALDDVCTAAEQLARLVGRPTSVAFVSAGEPRLADVDVTKAAVATYLLAPGSFADAIAGCGAPVVSKPIGAHPAIAEIALARYLAACQHAP